HSSRQPLPASPAGSSSTYGMNAGSSLPPATVAFGTHSRAVASTASAGSPWVWAVMTMTSSARIAGSDSAGTAAITGSPASVGFEDGSAGASGSPAGSRQTSAHALGSGSVLDSHSSAAASGAGCGAAE